MAGPFTPLAAALARKGVSLLGKKLAQRAAKQKAKGHRILQTHIRSGKTLEKKRNEFYQSSKDSFDKTQRIWGSKKNFAQKKRLVEAEVKSQFQKERRLVVEMADIAKNTDKTIRNLTRFQSGKRPPLVDLTIGAAVGAGAAKGVDLLGSRE